MRVIAGSLRGRQIDAPPGMTTRPMLDRVRQAVFDILGSAYGDPGTIPPVAVLDCFAGSGALGIEAMSRGAAFCCFVEEDFSAGKTLTANLKSLGLGERTRLLRESAATVSGRPPIPAMLQAKTATDADSSQKTLEPADLAGYAIVFLDPPYPISRDSSADSTIGRLLVSLPERIPLTSQATIVLRHEAGIRYDEQSYGRLKAFDVRRYGGMDVTFMEATPG